MTDPAAITIDIVSEADVVTARMHGKEMARQMGFGMVDQTRIATGISELTRNILQYAGTGQLTLRPLSTLHHCGLEIVAQDQGPGIQHLGRLLSGRANSGRGLGLGIPGTRRLMDEFDIQSEVGHGTTVRCVKRLP